MPDIILLGDINIDINATLATYPVHGSEGIVQAVTYSTGGSVVNTATALAKTGADAGIIGRIGSDTLAAQAWAYLKNISVDWSQIQVDPDVSTGLVYIAVTPDGERTMFSARGANAFTQATPAWESYFANARWYHFSGYALLTQPQHNAAIYGLKLARQNHCLISLDPNPEPAIRYGKKIKETLSEIDIFLPNEQELSVLFGRKNFNDAIKDTLDAGVKTVATKRGSKGCVIANANEYLKIPGFNIQAKNTTGAGDSFNAGVILGRTAGLSWAASGILGNALGAIASLAPVSGVAEAGAGAIIKLIEKDRATPRWAEWRLALQEVTAYLATTQQP